MTVDRLATLIQIEYVSLSFSADGKLLLAQGGGPEWNMVLWVWEKSKIAGTVKTTNQQGLPVFAVSSLLLIRDGSLSAALMQHSKRWSFSMSQEHILACRTWASNMYRHIEANLEFMALLPPPIHAQCNYSPGDGGMIGVLGQNIFKDIVPVQHGTEFKNVFSCENTGGGLVVQCIVCYSKGFVVGQDGGVVTIFEKDDKEMYRRARAFTIENNPVKIK
eukprot:1159984-Pelagomonas_calceolata.AAC.4